MNPTGITYEATMTAYAIYGSILEMKRLTGQMKQENFNLSQNQLSSILLSLIKNGHAGTDFENLDYVCIILITFVPLIISFRFYRLQI